MSVLCMDKIRTFQSFKNPPKFTSIYLLIRKPLEYIFHRNQGVNHKRRKTKDLGSRCCSVGERAGSSREEEKETSLARCQLLSSLESRQSRLKQGKTPEDYRQDWSEIDRLPKVFELLWRRLTALLESLRMN